MGSRRGPLDLCWLVTQTDASGSLSPLALATFMDHLPSSVETRQALLSIAPTPTGDAETDNVLAGLAETIADESGFPAPSWCSTIAPLAEPIALEGTPRMQERQRAAALPRFVARGITIPRTSLFRNRPAMDSR